MAQTNGLTAQRNLGFGRTEAPANTNRNGRNEEFVPSEYWVNIGYFAPHPETGEQVFIGLPQGIGLDTIKTKSPGNSQILQAKNALLANLLESCKAELEPGQEEYLTDRDQPWVIQIRRSARAEAATAATNPLIAAAAKLSFASKVA